MSLDNTAKTNFSLKDNGTTIFEGFSESNTTITELINDLVILTKSSDKSILVQDDEAKMTITITNGAAVAITNATFKDTMTSGATFVPGTVTIGGTSYNNYDPVAGFNIPTIQPGDSVTITFIVQADNPVVESMYENFGTLEFDMKDPSSGKPLAFSLDTNKVDIALIDATLIMTKLADKGYVITGDTLAYSISINNPTPFTASEIYFVDPIPSGTTFVVGSVQIDGATYPAFDPSVGFNIADITAGDTVIVTFVVEVD